MVVNQTHLYLLFLTISASSFVRRKQPSPEPITRREVGEKPDVTNGKLSGSSHAPQHPSFGMPSPNSPDFDEEEDELESEPVDRRFVSSVILLWSLVSDLHTD